MSMRRHLKGLTQRTRPSAFVVFIIAVLLASGLHISDISAKGKFLSFKASHQGEFRTGPGPGNSPPLFAVTETAEGYAEGLGAFTFTSSLVQNSARVPEGCTSEGSSIGVQGEAAMTLTAGTIRLRLVKGEACVDTTVSPPVVETQQQWVIVGGTGRYRNATGQLTEALTGRLDTFTFSGTWSGMIRLH
jgi:hypothetical protein